MQTYTLSQTRNQHGEVFDRAAVEPILVTKQKRPSHVILSAEAYQTLIEHIESLEDEKLGHAAKVAQSTGTLMGSEAFTAALETLANA